MLQQQIYEIFTIQNNIKLSRECIQLIQDNITHDNINEQACTRYQTQADSTQRNIAQEITQILQKYILISKSNVCDINILRSIFNTKILSVNYQYSAVSLLDHYNFLRSMYKHCISIADIKMSEQCCILGYVYKNKENDILIEDDSGILKLKQCKYTEVFVQLQGYYDGEYYIYTNMEEYNDNAVLNTPCTQRVTVSYTMHDKPVFIVRSEQPNNCNKICKQPHDELIVHDDYPVVVIIDKLKMSLYNKEVIRDIEHIYTYMSNYNHNYKQDIPLFYNDIYDVHIVASSKHDCMQKVGDRMFVMMRIDTSLQIEGTTIQFAEKTS